MSEIFLNISFSKMIDFLSPFNTKPAHVDAKLNRHGYKYEQEAL